MNRFCKAFALFLAFFAVGCGGGDNLTTAPVSGKVTYKNTPVDGALVQFYPEKGPLYSATTAQDGTFTLKGRSSDGVVVGSGVFTVTLQEEGASPISDTPPDDPEKLGEYMLKHEAAEKKGPPKSLIPEKYSNPKTSGLKFEVKEGTENDFPLDLKD